MHTCNTASVQPPTRLANLRRFSEHGSLPSLAVSGVVGRITSSYLVVFGLSKFVTLGDSVVIDNGRGGILAEVAAIDTEAINVIPLSSSSEVALGASVRATFKPLELLPDNSWCGRVVNAIGEPLDGKEPLRKGARAVAIHNRPPPALSRGRLSKAIATGIKAVDLFTPICAGQRVGIFAGSGVGKSTLLAMLARAVDFDKIIIGLVGERGREVRDFLDDALSHVRSKVVAVVATSDEGAMMRRLAPSAAMSIAEFFRDQGDNVLLVIDSVTRFAHAMRELGLAFNEPPVARGYPPSVFSALPQLLERAGPGVEGSGAITAVISVLVDGDDHNEPIADAVRGILDGHIVLDRAIAAQGRFPAIDPLRSLSRVAPRLRNATQNEFVTQITEMIARFEDTRDLRAIGGYQAGSDATLDRAIALVPRIYDAMRQDLNAPRVHDAYAHLAETLQTLRTT